MKLNLYNKIFFVCLFLITIGVRGQVVKDSSEVHFYDFESIGNGISILSKKEILDATYSESKKYICELPFYMFGDVDYGENPMEQKDKSPVTIFTEIEYKLGVKVKVVGFFENGQKYCEVYFNNKGLCGVQRKWYSNGQQMSLSIYEDGGIETFSIMCYRNGKLQLVSDNSANKGNCISKIWYRNGSFANETTYLDSLSESFMEKSYYPTGKLKLEGIFNRGIQLLKMYWENGSLFKKGNMGNMPLYKYGKWEEWYESGQLKLESHYHDSIPNMKINTWKYYSDKGDLIKEEEYRSGELIGTKEYLPLKRKSDF